MSKFTETSTPYTYDFLVEHLPDPSPLKYDLFVTPEPGASPQLSINLVQGEDVFTSISLNFFDLPLIKAYSMGTIVPEETYVHPYSREHSIGQEIIEAIDEIVQLFRDEFTNTLDAVDFLQNPLVTRLPIADETPPEEETYRPVSSYLK